VEHYANFGTGERWVSRLMIDVPKVLDATTLQNRDEIKLMLSDVFEALVDAFNDLRQLGEVEGKASVPLTERQGAYSAFYVHVWRAYRDRFQKLPPLLGYDLGFLWGNDKQFETGAERFIQQHPEIDAQFVSKLRENREWQNPLSVFRNDHLEHKKTLDAEFVAGFYQFARAEQVFECVWRIIEGITVQLLRPHLFPGFTLAGSRRDSSRR
jgi:hypothetical protein